MIAFLIISGIVIAIVFSWAWIKFVNWILPSKKLDLENPYIHLHLMRRANDKAYNDYLDWLDHTDGGLPIEKIKTQEEFIFEQEIKKQL